MWPAYPEACALCALLAPRPAGAAVVGLLDRLDQLRLGHPATAGDLQLLRLIHQVLLARVRVDPAGRLGLRVAPAGRLGVARTLPFLRLPMVAGLLERVLQRGERGAVGPLALAVLLDRGVMRLDVSVLRLLRRPPYRAGHVFSRWHDNLLMTSVPARDRLKRESGTARR